MSKTLKLTVNKTWFDMFKAGIKKEEYRELKQYWIKRLTIDNSLCQMGSNPIAYVINAKEFDFVELTNGYNKKSPSLLFEFKGTRIDNDFNMDWGGHLICDEEGSKKHCFIISVGREVGRLNC
jgi:hypothetical protein